MDIKPTVIPTSTPISDTQRIGPASRQVDSAEQSAFDAHYDQSAAVASPEVARAPIVDAGEARVGNDPWLADGTTSQRLLLTGLPTQSGMGDVANQSLPDAVRSAVDFVFTES